MILKDEDRGFDTGYDAAVLRVNEVGLDYKLLLAKGMVDPMGRAEDSDAPLVFLWIRIPNIQSKYFFFFDIDVPSCFEQTWLPSGINL